MLAFKRSKYGFEPFGSQWSKIKVVLDFVTKLLVKSVHLSELF